MPKWVWKICHACGSRKRGIIDFVQVCDNEECERVNSGKDRDLYVEEDYDIWR